MGPRLSRVRSQTRQHGRGKAVDAVSPLSNGTNDETMDKLADYWASQDGERFTKVRVAREGQVIDLSE